MHLSPQAQRVEPPETLRRRFELARTEIAVAGRHYDLLRPRCIEDLISEEDFALDERIPYWAECWPSARVLASDYYADALEFTAANADRHALRGIDTRLVDWRKLPSDLGTFDVVAASDVLYELPQAALVATALARTLSPDSLGLVSDPGRRVAGSFIEECGKRRLSAVCVQQAGAVDAGTRLTVSVFEIRHV